MNFDSIIQRENTHSLKWDQIKHPANGLSPIPLWVADMDFAVPGAVQQALKERIQHPIYGYTITPESYYEAIQNWYTQRHALSIEKKHILNGPGLVPSMAIAIRSLSEEGDSIIVPSPVYHPFYKVVEKNNRHLRKLVMPLDKDGRYILDPVALEKTFAEAAAQKIRTPLLLLCSPHNPSGTVWTEAELKTVLAIAEKYNAIIISDEIHADITRKNIHFCSLAAFDDYAHRIIVLASANKTFNIAGLHLSHYIIRDDALRLNIKKYLSAYGFDQSNVLSLTAAESAYREGGPWLDEMLDYLDKNIRHTVSRLKKAEMGIQTFEPEGGYLVWASASELIERKKMKDETELVLQVEEQTGVKLLPGSIFGDEGHGYIRINVACPRKLLDEALDRFIVWAKE